VAGQLLEESCFLQQNEYKPGKKQNEYQPGKVKDIL